jgi:hypothetical protein
MAGNLRDTAPSAVHINGFLMAMDDGSADIARHRDHTALRDELQRAHANRDYAAPELRSAVRALAANAHHRGETPEGMLVALKGIFDDGALQELSTWWRSIMRDRVVRWAIEAYFDVSITGSGPRHP